MRKMDASQLALEDGESVEEAPAKDCAAIMGAKATRAKLG